MLLIQREAIHTHPFPRQLTELVRVMPNRGTDIRYRLPAILRYHQALLQYWKYSTPASVKNRSRMADPDCPLYQRASDHDYRIKR